MEKFESIERYLKEYFLGREVLVRTIYWVKGKHIEESYKGVLVGIGKSVHGGLGNLLLEEEGRKYIVRGGIIEIIGLL